MNLSRLSLADLILDEPLLFDVLDDTGRVLIPEGDFVQHTRVLDGMLARGLFVDADSVGYAKTIEEKRKATSEPPSVIRTINSINRRLNQLLRNPTGDSQSAMRIRETVRLVTRVVDLSAEVALASILYNQEAAPYPVRHSVDAAIVTVVLGQAMSLPKFIIESLAGAALTMNISQIAQQETYQKQKTPLTPEQKAEILSHPERSVAILQQIGIQDDVWLNAVLHHHELGDGSGYPRGLGNDDLKQEYRILPVADRYCARVSSREYRNRLTANTAVMNVMKEDHRFVDPALADCIVRTLGLFPTGSIVRLANAEIGIVVEQTDKYVAPLVLALRSGDGLRVKTTVKRKTATPEFAIKDVLGLDDRTIEVSMNQIWGALASA